jgi:hypothetical protein
MHHCPTCDFDLCEMCLPADEAKRLQSSTRIDTVIEATHARFGRKRAPLNQDFIKLARRLFVIGADDRFSGDIQDAVLRGVREGRYKLVSELRSRTRVPVELDPLILWQVQ